MDSLIRSRRALAAGDPLGKAIKAAVTRLTRTNDVQETMLRTEQ
jgi:hypothetical protein